jgi:hypothetical protein
MNGTTFGELISRIHQEFNEINRVIERVNNIWERARRATDDYYLDAVALNLHGFYLGFERIFTYIAETVDNDLPQGEHWHLSLLQQMTMENPGVRPAVISVEAGIKLDEYRGFRHVVRNVYTHHLNPELLGKLVREIPPTFAQLKSEVSAFVSFLESEDT